MEATNFSIKQQSSVSTNIETLQAIKQHLWFMVKGAWFMVKGAWSPSRLYRKELRMAHAVARMIDARLTPSNIFLWLMGIAIMIEVFLFA